MYAILKHRDSYAMIYEREWISDDKDFERLLNLLLPEDGTSGSDPQSDVTEAYRIADFLGGEVVEEEMDKHKAGRIY